MNLEQFEFKKIEGGYSLIKYTGEEQKVVIPDIFQAEPVVEIGYEAFRESSICEVLLPNTLKIIKYSAFCECTFLKKVSIPNSVEEMDIATFCRCLSLEKLKLPNQLKIIPKYCFSDCYALEVCELPAGLEHIEASAFSGCANLKEIILPTSVKSVESQAFTNCASLKRVVCTHQDIKIHKKAFYYYGDTESKLEELPYHIWRKVDLTLGQIIVLLKSLISSYESFSKTEKKDFISFLKRRKNMKELLFLQGDSEIISLILSLGKKINLDLDEVDLYLEESIKQEKTQVTALFLDYKNKFFSKTEIESYTENKELVEIGLELPTLKQFKAKWRCNKVEGGLRVFGYKGVETEATIMSELADGTKIISIGHSQITDFRTLRKITLEEGILTIEENAFFDCSHLEEIILPDSLESIGDGAFSFCQHLKSITIPKNVKELPNACFRFCNSLEKVVLQEGLLTVGDYAFEQCEQLVEVIFPDSVTEFKEATTKTRERGLFSHSGILTVTIPPKVTKLPNQAFYGCFSLVTVILHDNITDFGSGTFKLVHTLADEKGFVIVGNVLFDYIPQSNLSCHSVTIPLVNKNSFSDNRVKESLFIVPENVERISNMAFNDCEMEELVLPEGLKVIEPHAISSCNDLTKILVPSSVKYLPKNAFQDCRALENIVISSSITVENNALRNCPLAKIVFK